MVPWYWLIVVWFVTTIVTWFAFAMCNASKED